MSQDSQFDQIPQVEAAAPVHMGKEAKQLAKAEAKLAKQLEAERQDALRAQAKADENALIFKKAQQAHPQVNIIVDSTGDFDPAVANALGVTVIGFPYVLDGQEHIDDLFQTTSAREFYDKMREGSYPTTSAVTPGRYYEVFKEAAEAGVPTIYLGLNRALSSSIESAQTAVEMIREEYPDFEIYAIDNRNPSAAGELLTMEAVHQANLGATAEDLVAWVEEAGNYLNGYFTLENFDALARGGRIPAAAASIGGKLDIKPELTYDESGALTLMRMCRGRKKALKAIVEDFRANNTGESTMPIAIVTADAEKDGDWLEAQIRKEPGFESVPVVRSSVSPVIGSHVGPGMVAMVFWGKDRREQKGITGRIAAKLGRK